MSQLPNIHHDCCTTVGNTIHGRSLSSAAFSAPPFTTLVAPLCCLHCRNWHLTNRSLNKYIYICIYRQHGFCCQLEETSRLVLGCFTAPFPPLPVLVWLPGVREEQDEKERWRCHNTQEMFTHDLKSSFSFFFFSSAVRVNTGVDV